MTIFETNLIEVNRSRADLIWLQEALQVMGITDIYLSLFYYNG